MAAPAKPGQLRVLALTKDTAKHLTWRLRGTAAAPSGSTSAAQRATPSQGRAYHHGDVQHGEAVRRRLDSSPSVLAGGNASRAATLHVRAVARYRRSRLLQFEQSLQFLAVALLAFARPYAAVPRSWPPTKASRALTATRSAGIPGAAVHDPDAYAMSVRPRLAGEPLPCSGWEADRHTSISPTSSRNWRPSAKRPRAQR